MTELRAKATGATFGFIVGVGTGVLVFGLPAVDAIVCALCGVSVYLLLLAVFHNV